MRHVREPLRRSSRSYEGNFELILVMGWERELNSIRSNLPLFLSSSVVERSAVNRLVVGSNPTWGDLIHSELKNSEWKGLLWPLRVGNPFPVSLFLLHSISSYHIVFYDFTSTKGKSIPKFNSFTSAIPIMIFLPSLRGKVKVLPPLEGCGRGGIRTPDTVVRSHVL